MKPVAAIILNRNLPEITDQLGVWITEQAGELVDIYVIENGSDPNKYSKFANIIFSESLGPARGINEALQQVVQQKYDYFWINYNDARYNQNDFLQKALQYFEANPKLGLFFPHWPHNMWLWGNQAGLSQVCFTDLLGFIITRSALEALGSTSRFHFEPLWDSSNYSNHFNILATLMALYTQGFWAGVDLNLTIYELVEAAATASIMARGYTDEVWKQEIGPRETREWLSRVFPEYSGNAKEIRERVIIDIKQQVMRHFPFSVSLSQRTHQNLSYFGRHFLHL